MKNDPVTTGTRTWTKVASKEDLQNVTQLTAALVNSGLSSMEAADRAYQIYSYICDKSVFKVEDL